jgi:hypothetical protein
VLQHIWYKGESSKESESREEGEREEEEGRGDLPVFQRRRRD